MVSVEAFVLESGRSCCLSHWQSVQKYISKAAYPQVQLLLFKAECAATLHTGWGGDTEAPATVKKRISASLSSAPESLTCPPH